MKTVYRTSPWKTFVAYISTRAQSSRLNPQIVPGGPQLQEPCVLCVSCYTRVSFIVGQRMLKSPLACGPQMRALEMISNWSLLNESSAKCWRVSTGKSLNPSQYVLTRVWLGIKRWSLALWNGRYNSVNRVPFTEENESPEHKVIDKRDVNYQSTNICNLIWIFSRTLELNMESWLQTWL